MSGGQTGSGDLSTGLEQRNLTTTVNARIFKLEYGMFFVVIIALMPLNIPCK